ncbi:MAG: RNA polymerase sporulation sigma factor SigH [Clostridiales bacterium]|nr:RNA polymerase sporulation sigma factor SigH [Clostridiales bacterium]
MRLKYEEKTDLELLRLAREGDKFAEEALIERYKGFVRVKARAYYIIGADKDDIIQEGTIGLFKAIRDYKENNDTTFFSFADLCVTRQIMTAIKAANRQKHIPLNSSVSLNRNFLDEDKNSTYLEFLSDGNLTNPEVLVIGNEERENIEAKILKALSKFERQVLIYHLRGLKYTEIAKLMNKEDKSIDNALQRIKKKVLNIFKEKT